MREFLEALHIVRSEDEVLILHVLRTLASCEEDPETRDEEKHDKRTIGGEGGTSLGTEGVHTGIGKEMRSVTYAQERGE